MSYRRYRAPTAYAPTNRLKGQWQTLPPDIGRKKNPGIILGGQAPAPGFPLPDWQVNQATLAVAIG